MSDEIIAKFEQEYKQQVKTNDIAEIELRVLTKQCLNRRIAAIETLRQETKAWEHERNAKQTGVDWQFTTEDARIRLKRLYPQYQG